MEVLSLIQKLQNFSYKAPDNLKKKLEFVGLIENKENVLEIQKT